MHIVTIVESKFRYRVVSNVDVIVFVKFKIHFNFYLTSGNTIQTARTFAKHYAYNPTVYVCIMFLLIYNWPLKRTHPIN